MTPLYPYFLSKLHMHVLALTLLPFFPALFLNLFSSFWGHLQQNSASVHSRVITHINSQMWLHVNPAKTLEWWWRSSWNATLSWECQLVAPENRRIHFWSGCGSRKVICTPNRWRYPLNMFISPSCLYPLDPRLNILRETSLNSRNQKKMRIMLTQLLQLGTVWVGHS